MELIIISFQFVKKHFKKNRKINFFKLNLNKKKLKRIKNMTSFFIVLGMDNLQNF